MAKHAIITGASKGLGKALASELASQGYDLFLIARSQSLLVELCDSLNKQHSTKASYLAADLTHHDAIAQITDWCAEHRFEPSVLVNNAGYGCWGYFDSLAIDRQLDMLQLHIQSMVALTHAILPLLKKQPKGYVLNVCSTSAYQAVPTMTLYAASKTFVRSFSRGLRYELRRSDVSVTCLSPGPMATDFVEQANMQALQSTAQKFEMPAAQVARSGIRAMFNRRAEVIPGAINFIGVALSKIVPDALLERIAARIYESKI